MDNGYEPLPIIPGQKRPAPSRWTKLRIDTAQVDAWANAYPEHGVGIRTGSCCGLDIDVLDPDLAHQLHRLAVQRLGDAPLRVGRWPKRLLLYRATEAFSKLQIPSLEVLSVGQQFVAYGLHPDTGQGYHWPLGPSPLEVPLEDLPAVTEADLHAFLAEAHAMLPRTGGTTAARRRGGQGGHSRPVRNEDGLVVDGRDAWLSTIAFHAVHDALEAGGGLEVGCLTSAVWDRFTATTDLSRGAKDSARCWTDTDALRKVRDKLRLHAEDRLPPRDEEAIDTAFIEPERGVIEARGDLAAVLKSFCKDVLKWHETPVGPAPRIGIRAVVGLGKSRMSREHLLRLRHDLTASERPSRILVFTPSHRLAEEAAEAWQGDDTTVAVLRGYERQHPILKQPMCRDLDAVKAALAAGLEPQGAVCSRGEDRCRHFNGCLKQRNRSEVSDADVVVAPYDALFTGLPIEAASIGAIVIDEGFWARAVSTDTVGTVEGLASGHVDNLGTGMDRNRNAALEADRQVFRTRLRAALADPGPVTATNLARVGLSAEECRIMAGLEERRLRDPGLGPGLFGEARRRALLQAHANAGIRVSVLMWRALGDLLDSGKDCDGRVVVGSVDTATMTRPIRLTRLARVHPNFRDKPILHLDATLRPEIVGKLLPGIAIHEIDARAPHMRIAHVSGRFGKSAIVPDPRMSAEEQRRRSKNLSACIDYVRWQVLRYAPGRVLVVTYKAIEEHFAVLPGVETLHFNALAGLDSFGDVAALIVIGRPLADQDALGPLCAAFSGHVPKGGYVHQRDGIRMRDGSVRSVSIIEHEDDEAAVFRAAISDDEVIQAIGRGRGINRTAANPLDVHLLADVALPLVHDRLVTWDSERPDILQRMMLDGMAVDSPADAVVLHPDLFENAEQTKKVFERSGFKGHFPIYTYRGLSLKSARYKRVGRGRSWQTALWIDGGGDTSRRWLETTLGERLDWSPNV
ncbi:bifunctional DNA primase/polymerase [Pseudooceanicola sp.]|uniref:bifunctional DNA primase/polymerase n=1 Tax=Pseudooceanicola sp. TaxID=1914328 RepID=UPI0035C663B5